MEVYGSGILYRIPFAGGIEITEAVANTWLLMLAIWIASILLTKNMRLKKPKKRQIIAETLVKSMEALVKQNAGYENADICPFVAALLTIALFSGLLGITGLFAPAADLSSCIAWSLVVFVRVTLKKIRKKRIGGYFAGFAKPAAFMTPINIISEVSMPVSMAFRLFGNIASGTVVMLLIYAALYALGGRILQIGIPAVLSLYFDVFASVLQAYIFAMLAMIYIRLAGE